MPNFFKKYGVIPGSGGNALYDPAGLFSEGGMFGPEAQSPEDKAKADLIMRMLGREENLYPQLESLLKGVPGIAEEAYGADVGEINKVYPGVMGDITGYRLAPEAEQFLTNLRGERVNAIEGDVNRMISSKYADLAKKGMTSSTTAEGAGREVTQAALPAISKANEDYWNAKLTLPGQNAAQRYNLAASYGATKGEALRRKLSTMYDPLSQMWNTTLGGANIPTKETDPNAGADRLLGLGAIATKIWA